MLPTLSLGITEYYKHQILAKRHVAVERHGSGAPTQVAALCACECVAGQCSDVSPSAAHVCIETTPTCQTNSMVGIVRERTIPTERPPLLGEVIANFCG
jgi:hypothetical protein